MPAKIFDADPVAVLVDRSRDASSGGAFPTVLPDRVFWTTDHWRRLTTKRLAGYHVLAICGNGCRRPTPGELGAIRAFVRRGGTLILGANAGRFERDTGLPISRLAANAVADPFGFAFLSAADSAADVEGIRGYPRSRLVLTAAGRRFGARMGEIAFEQPGPLQVPRGATVLMRVRGGAPVAAVAGYGRGRILVTADTGIWDQEYFPWAATHWLLAAAPKRRRRVERPPAICAVPYRVRTSGAIRMVYPAPQAARAREVLRLAEKVWLEVRRLAGSKTMPHTWHLEVVPGCGSGSMWWKSDPLYTHVGADFSDAATVGTLCNLLSGRSPFGCYGPLATPTRFYLRIHILRKLGFDDLAARQIAACQGGPRADLARVYEWTKETGQRKRLWLEIAEEFGHDAFRRYVASVPRKNEQKHLDRPFYTDLDMFAFHLARAAGRTAYGWLEAQGHTVRRIPLTKPG